MNILHIYFDEFTPWWCGSSVDVPITSDLKIFICHIWLPTQGNLPLGVNADMEKLISLHF